MYNQFHHHSGRYYRYPVEKVIRENMENYVGQLRTMMKVSSFGVAACFICFALFGFMTMSLMGNFVMVLIPFFGFGIFGFFAAINSAKYHAGLSILRIINQIKAADKIAINEISYDYMSADKDVLYVIKLLFDTGNLNDYEIIENKYVARKDINFRISNTDKQYEQSSSFCQLCGNRITNQDIYCSKCGRRLR